MKSQVSSQTPGLLSVKAAAAWLGVSISWLNKTRSSGGGPKHIKIGSRCLYDPDDLREFAAMHRRNVTIVRGR